MLGEFGKLLRAIANGPDPAKIPAPTEVIPTIELGRPPASWAWSADTYLWCGYAIEANGAGVRSQVALYNPTGSGCIADVEGIYARTDVDTVLVTLCNYADIALFDSDGVHRPRDPRSNVSTITNRPNTCQILSDQAAIAGDAALRAFAKMYDAATYYTFEIGTPFVLLPGTAINVVPKDDNVGLNCSFVWSERRLDPAEVRGTRTGQFI